MTVRNLLCLVRGKLWYLMLACLALSAPGLQAAAVSGDQINTEEDLKQSVAGNTREMVDKLAELRAKYDARDEAFYREMDAELSDFIDFRRIAARVMARYARQASPSQRDAFVEKFKRSLFDTYANALAETDDFKVTVSSARFLDQSENRALVDLTVTAESGKSYDISYSLFKNSDGRWMMENIVVEGVDIGLAFRDRFQQEMERHRGDLQAVIDNWSGQVEIGQEKAEKIGQEAETGG